MQKLRTIGEQDYKELATDLLDRAKRKGATEADVMVADGNTFSVQVRLAAVDRLTKAREKRLGIRIFFGRRSASASTTFGRRICCRPSSPRTERSGLRVRPLWR